MWTIEANLFNDEVRTQGSKTDSPRPGVHLSRAFRALADESRALSLANRYESRLQRIYDRSYRTLRELQYARQPHPAVPLPTPSSPRTDAPTLTDSPASPDAPHRADAPVHRSRDSHGAVPCSETTPPPPQPELPNEPTDTAPKELSDNSSTGNAPQSAHDRPNTNDPTPDTDDVKYPK
jgi:hypothetical protein